MKKTDLVQLMQKLGIAPSKKLGQNFLVDDQFLDWIIRYADVQEGENILEIGPGFGALTERMIAKKANLTAIEFDRKLAEYLRGALVPKGLKLIEGVRRYHLRRSRRISGRCRHGRMREHR